MVARILFILCLLAMIPQFLSAQCDAEKYNFILKEANSLREEGQFILAKNNYEAAMQFACTDEQKEHLETQVDGLFAQIEKLRLMADSTANAAQQAAWRAYANDLAVKSQIALKQGNRTTAFRLAEFAQRYVDEGNQQVTQALVESLHYKTNPPLSWASNFYGHRSRIISVAFSPDGQRLATGSMDNTTRIWDLESGKMAMTL